MDKAKNPRKCGKSIKFGKSYICKLELCPCDVIDGCAIDKMTAFVESMIKNVHDMVKEDGGE